DAMTIASRLNGIYFIEITFVAITLESKTDSEPYTLQNSKSNFRNQRSRQNLSLFFFYFSLSNVVNNIHGRNQAQSILLIFCMIYEICERNNQTCIRKPSTSTCL